jgi:DNA repair protein RecN (Recombination protein N)
MVMIAELSIQNLVLADQIRIQLQPGLVALTGETGAGKSLIGQALHLAAGGRAKSGLIRRGEDEARIDLVLQFEGSAQRSIDRDLKALGLPQSEDGRIVVRRVLKASGGTRSWIGGSAVSLRSLQTLWKNRLMRIDQGAATTLNSTTGRLALLDRALPRTAPVEAMKQAAEQWHAAQAELERLTDQLESQRDQREMIRHWVDELIEFAPAENEYDELLDTRRLVRSQRQQRAALQRAETVIGSDKGVLSSLGEMRRIAATAVDAEPLYELVAQADHAVDSYLRQLQEQSTDLVKVDEDALQERLFRWRDLARKHRCSEPELTERFRELSAQLEQLDAPEEVLAEASQQASQARLHAETVAQKLSDQRLKSAKKVETSLTDLLPGLGFQGAKMKLSLSRKPQLNASGWDQLDLLFQANPGEGFTPVQDGASGGEKARLLLALDCSLPRTDSLSTVFYDEVDAGMGGAAAAAVARLLANQSRAVQVLVITHQAAVAAAADQHLAVHKATKKGRTLLSTHTLNASEREHELARMTSGHVAPEAAKAVARALIDEGGAHAIV